MKRLYCLAAACTFVALQGAFAQRNNASPTVQLVGETRTIEYSESSSLKSGHEMIVTPLVASVEVISNGNDGKTFEHRIFTGSARQDVPTGLAGNEYLVSKLADSKQGVVNIDLLKAQVIYDFCQEANADLIVLPQFKIRHKTTPMSAVDVNGRPITIDQPVEYNGKYVMIVEAMGFPARYSGFRVGTENDRWIKDMYRMGQIDNVDEKIHVVEQQVNARVK